MTAPKQRHQIRKGPGHLHIATALLLPYDSRGMWFHVGVDDHNPIWVDPIELTVIDGIDELPRSERRLIRIKGVSKSSVLDKSGELVFVIIDYDFKTHTGLLYVVDDLAISITPEIIYQRQGSEPKYCFLVYRSPIQDVPGKISLTQCDSDGNTIEEAGRPSLPPRVFHLVYRFLRFRP